MSKHIESFGILLWISITGGIRRATDYNVEDYFVWETVVNAAFAILYIASAVFHLRRGEKKSALLSVMIVLLLIGSCLYEWHYLNEMRELQ